MRGGMELGSLGWLALTVGVDAYGKSWLHGVRCGALPCALTGVGKSWLHDAVGWVSMRVLTGGLSGDSLGLEGGPYCVR